MDDPFKYSPYRFAGHSYAIGQALTYNFSQEIVDNCTTMACAYVLWHAAYRVFQKRNEGIRISTLYDPIIFDVFASALVPAYIVSRVCKCTAIAMRGQNNLPEIIMIWGPMTMGIVSLFYLYEPIDDYVQTLMNDTVRKFY